MVPEVEVPDWLRRHVRRQAREHYALLVGSLLVIATALWALAGPGGVYPLLGGLVGSALAERWRWWRRREQYLAAVEISAALRTGTSPRPGLRTAALRVARRELRELPVAGGAVGAVFGILALACAVTAGLRDDVRPVLAAALCVTFAAGLLVGLRAKRGRTEQWLADHPPPRPEDPS
ncbi:hypothetical protein SAMN04515665_1233 [Blastococcus sp. DSM 46786]|uniref:hypothetical protein n=1 Tax=Blastococcus sp. DSM 46786 TaxID=1798227 RepID=UPI0008CBCD11|nr:hypothetical protein [Blastococcus sp. DSM 46786]SEL91092.1 hypothetical protein SAMN04515665_1233 [Blastococcus sp. DSM 46786]